MEISENARELLTKFQNLQQQHQMLLAQKESLSMQYAEAKAALEEVKKSEGKLFRVVGPVMLGSKKADIEKDLSERIESSELRIKSIEKQEKIMMTKLEDIQEAIRKELPAAGGG